MIPQAWTADGTFMPPKGMAVGDSYTIFKLDVGYI